VSAQQEHGSTGPETPHLHALLRFCDPASLPPLSAVDSERLLDQVLAKMETARAKRANHKRTARRVIAVLGSLLLAGGLLLKLAH
jgi:hypothetical protein